MDAYEQIMVLKKPIPTDLQHMDIKQYKQETFSMGGMSIILYIHILTCPHMHVSLGHI
jgi:hypothetical protein